MNKNLLYLVLLFITLSFQSKGQDTTRYIFTYEIIDGDTVAILQLKEFEYKDPDFAKQWRRAVFFTRRVYPYAQIIDSIVKRQENELTTIAKKKRGKKRKIRKSNKKLKKSLGDEYGLEIKNMSVTRGRYLAKLVHKNTGFTVYELIKKYKTGSHALFWHMIMKIYGGANLKAKYNPKDEDWMLALVLKEIESGNIKPIPRSIQKKALEDELNKKKRKKK